MKYIKMSWDELSSILENLYTMICKDGKPDKILVIMRGGLIPATYFSYKLGITVFDIVSITRTLSNSPFAEKQPSAINWVSPLKKITGKDF